MMSNKETVTRAKGIATSSAGTMADLRVSGIYLYIPLPLLSTHLVSQKQSLQSSPPLTTRWSSCGAKLTSRVGIRCAATVCDVSAMVRRSHICRFCPPAVMATLGSRGCNAPLHSCNSSPEAPKPVDYAIDTQHQWFKGDGIYRRQLKR